MAEMTRKTDTGGSWMTDPVVRGYVFQALAVIGVVVLIYFMVVNTAANIERKHVQTGLGFVTQTTGFDLAQSLIPYGPESTIGTALLVGLLNTVLVSVIGIIFATLLGLVIGISRLSSNWLISRLATAYVEIIRNIPLLLQIFFWYFGVLNVLPDPKNSLQPIPGWIFINKRGFVFPDLTMAPATKSAMELSIVAAIVAIVGMRMWASRRQAATGKIFPVGWVSLALIVGLPLIAFVVSGGDYSLTAPKKSVFNVSGGVTIIPELLALIVALTVYTASYIGETVRAGILAVSHGQIEASRALGLQGGQTLKLVVLPQALRVIIPPLTNQYLNLTKNSSLAVAVGYPDLVYVGETVFSKLGHEMEVIGLWMLIYLGTSLITSAFMNWYNRRIAIVER